MGIKNAGNEEGLYWKGKISCRSWKLEISTRKWKGVVRKATKSEN